MGQELISATKDGWTTLRWAVLKRDGGCIAVQRDKVGDDVAADGCIQKNGWAIAWDQVMQMEMDHVKERPAMSKKAPDDEAHLVTVCSWHHRGGPQGAPWATGHRAAERRYLGRLYPEVWGT